MSNITNLLQELDNNNIELVSVTKTRSEEQINALYNRGLRIFGENRVKELITKHKSLPQDIKWHMIGHLQRKKVKSIISIVDLIHSLDRISLWEELDKHAKKNGLIIKCLLEIKIATEKEKAGFDYKELINLLEESHHKTYSNVKICGVMGMATFTEDIALVHKEFSKLKSHFEYLKKHHFRSDDFQWISMGMSNDYKIAISTGANMVRIGSLLFKD